MWQLSNLTNCDCWFSQLSIKTGSPCMTSELVLVCSPKNFAMFAPLFFVLTTDGLRNFSNTSFACKVKMSEMF